MGRRCRLAGIIRATYRMRRSAGELCLAASAATVIGLSLLSAAVVLSAPALAAETPTGTPAPLPSIPVDPAAVPDHLRIALAATAGRIMGVPARVVKPVEFAPAAEAAFAGLQIRPAGFGIAKLTLTRIIKAKRGKASRFGVDGVFGFLTPEGRRAKVAFSIKYAFNANRFRIELADLHPILPHRAKIAFAALPWTVNEAEVFPKASTFETSLSAALVHAYRSDTPPTDLPNPPQYLLVGAFLDWLPEKTPIAVWLSSDKEALDLPTRAEIVKPTVRDFGGWRIYLLRVRLNPGDPQPKYAKFAWTPPAGPGVASSPELLGVYPLPVGGEPTGREGNRTAAAAPDAPARSTDVVASDISGNWSTTDGRVIEIKQNGNRVSWTSCCQPRHEQLVTSVSGVFDGKNLVATYHYREGAAQGDGTLNYTLNGDRLEGVWNLPDGKPGNAALIRHRGKSVGSLGGKWMTVAGRTVNLTQTGDQVSWATCCRQSHPNWTADIAASFDGKNLTGTFHWRDGDKQGNGTVSYVLKGTQLEGALETPGKEPYRSMLTRLPESALGGSWTAEDGGRVDIRQNGAQVGMKTCCRPGHPNWTAEVAGTFDGKNVVGLLQWHDGDAQGIGTVSYTLDGNRLDGTVQLPGGDPVKSLLTRQ